MAIFYVYILRCSDGSYYTGVTSDIENRLLEHQTGFHKDSYTYKRRPVELVFYTDFSDINMAIEKEKQLKKWSRLKKGALIDGKFEDLVNLSKKDFIR
ncbi:putative endonuclease [Balneicella halophila]|uniref:Putative endonuclease n=1 Tax=Balneicella halophila TaxID=1537566 RepID=A0A7L4UQQ1_BALHA|nr:GIY-YIG nuclease family protein [Balneicella halophila]PVX51842.1 putative endonuclease [Balneicella halophila]